MAYWEQMYPTIDFRSFQGYPNYFDDRWLDNSPPFLGLPALHIVNFFEYLSEIELEGEDALIKLFLLILPPYLQKRFKSCCNDRGISSFIQLINKFIEFTKPDLQTYEDVLQNLMVTLHHKGFTTEIVDDLRRAYHDQYQGPSVVEDEVCEDYYQPLEEEQESEKDDEVSTCALPADEALQDPATPAQDEENEVSYFDSFDDALFYDSENEGRMEPLDEPDSLYLQTEDVEEDLSSDDDIQILEALAQEGLSEVHCSPFQVLNGYLPYDAKSEKVLDVLNPPCYDTDTDIADFDEFIHVGRRSWDAAGYDLDPIYDTKDHLQTLPLQLPQQISFDQWQQGDEVFACSFQNPKDDDLVPCFSDDFQSYLEMFDGYAEHLNPFYEDDYRPLLCSDLATSEDIVCLKEITHDFPSQPPVISLPGFSIQGVIGEYLFRVEFPPGQALDFKGWLGNTISNQFFNLLLIICQPSTKLLSILPLECENVLGNQFTCPLNCFAEPSMFYDPFSDRIECFSQRWTWRDFVPPTRLRELEFGTPDDVIYVLTHDVFVLDFSLFWFMMKHKGRYQGALLDWLHWLFDYTNMRPAGKYR
jgi:hypothetical protein